MVDWGIRYISLTIIYLHHHKQIVKKARESNSFSFFNDCAKRKKLIERYALLREFVLSLSP